MLKRFIVALKVIAGLILMDSLLCLPYFLAAMLSYILWPSSEHLPPEHLPLSASISYIEIHFRGPDFFTLAVIGVFSPLIILLPIIPFLLHIGRLPLWIKIALFIIWIGGIFALGFFTPRMPFIFCMITSGLNCDDFHAVLH